MSDWLSDLSMVTVGVAAAVGLLVAWLLARASARLFFAVSPQDPIVYVATAGCSIAAAMAGVLVPALRAIRIDPVSALRQ
jgi:ABC-type antimicrobial peptide transport system permease subunit